MTGYILILVYMFFIVCDSRIIYGEQYCVEDDFDAMCNEGEVVIIQNATYGRMKIGKCIFENYRMDCYVNVLRILDRLCSGTNQCSFNVFDELSQANPCKQGLTPYLDATYTCIKEYCNNEIFHGQCYNGEVILMSNATYGRMNVGKCIAQHIGMGCSVDVTQIIDRLCSGKTECSFEVIDELSHTMPCALGLAPYLDTTYICITVNNLNDKACSDNVHHIDHKSTFHLSSDADEIQCTHTPPTWHLQVNPGQVIEVTLMDFTAPPESPTTCSSLGYIVEHVVRSNRTICGSNVQRHTVLYTSVGHVIEITMLPQTMRLQQGIFALEYQVRGCEEPPLQHNVYYKRDGSQAVVGCSPDDEQWAIECMNGMWKGELGNCTERDETGNSDSAFGSVITLFKDIPESVTIAIVIGIAVLLSLFVLVCGIVYIAKHRHTNDNISETYSHGPRRTDSEFKMYGPENSDTINKTPLMYQNTIGQHTPTKRNMYPTHGSTVDKRDVYPVNKHDTDVCSCASYSSIPRLDKDQSEIVDDKQIYLDPVGNDIQ